MVETKEIHLKKENTLMWHYHFILTREQLVRVVALCLHLLHNRGLCCYVVTVHNSGLCCYVVTVHNSGLCGYVVTVHNRTCSML